MSLSVRIAYRERQTRSATTFNGAYQTLGNPLPGATVLIKIINNSNRDIDISTNGSTNHDFVPIGGYFLYDVRTNNQIPSSNYAFREGLQFYVKGTAGTGDVYLVSLGDER